MKEINISDMIDEVIKHNKSIEKHNDDNHDKKEKISLAEIVSKNMLENIDKYKDK